MTTREQLLKEIADLDAQINRLVASMKLPRIEYHPFPKSMWILALLCFGWTMFGADIPLPNAAEMHQQYSTWSWNLGLVCLVWALISTVSWIFKRGRGRRQEKSENYMENSRMVQGLQEQRRELQARLRDLTAE